MMSAAFEPAGGHEDPRASTAARLCWSSPAREVTHVNRLLAVLILLPILFACGEEPPAAPATDETSGHVAPTQATARANAAVLDALPFADRQDFEDARRGFVAALERPVILDDEGREVWNLERFAFQTGEAPPSVNP